MTTLSAARTRGYTNSQTNAYPISSSTTIWGGAAVGIDMTTGLARAIQPGDPSVGFAKSSVNHILGQKRDAFVTVVDCGQVVLAVSGAAQTSVGKDVYATDDDTFTLTSPGGSFIGVAKQFVSAGKLLVEISPPFNMNVVRRSSDGLSLVDRDGIPNSVSIGALQGFSAATTIPEIVFDQSKGGQYLFTAYDAGNNYTSSLSVATGTLASMTKTAISATNVSNLKDTAGAAITAGAVVCAWWINETRFMFVGKKNSGNTNYVWICDYNGGAWKVGSNSTTFDNGNAVLALGLYSGGQAGLSGVLHSRSVAMNLDASKILIAEYNVATGRVTGAANDAIRVYQSADQGATWTALLTHNTSGNQMRHWHFVKFDPYNSARPWIIGGGDDPLSALIRWDGTSSAPAANTPLTQAGFAGYPGWEVMHDTAGIECRSGDIAIHPQTLHYMTDNSEVNTAEKYNFQVSKQRPLARVRANQHDRSIGRSPLICCELPNGATVWGTIREAQDLGASPESWQGYDFLYTPDGVTFHKIAKTRDVSASGTGTLSNIFMSNEGILVISGLNARGCKLRPSASTNGEGSLLVTLQPWDGTVRTLQGTA